MRNEDLLLLGAAVAVAALFTQRRRVLGSPMPFGPAISRPDPPLSMQQPPPMPMMIPGVGPSPYEGRRRTHGLGGSLSTTLFTGRPPSGLEDGTALITTDSQQGQQAETSIDTQGQQGQPVQQGRVYKRRSRLPLFQPGTECLQVYDPDTRRDWWCRDRAY
jgi:hypothetical protein